MSNIHPKKAAAWSFCFLLVIAILVYAFTKLEPKSEPFLAFNDYKVLAEKGDRYSQWVLGRYYYSGVDVKKDLTRSSYWFRKSAEQNYHGALYDLGIHYRDGIGLEQSRIQAAFWLFKAACNNYEYTAGNAQIALGDLYLDGGYGIVSDRSESYAWYATAANSNDQTIKRIANQKISSWGLGSQSDDYRLAHKRLDELSRRIERIKIDEQLFARITDETLRK